MVSKKYMTYLRMMRKRKSIKETTLANERSRDVGIHFVSAHHQAQVPSIVNHNHIRNFFAHLGKNIGEFIVYYKFFLVQRGTTPPM